jgi:hypothetical protein
MRLPTDANTAAMIASATSASISVKPALFSGGVEWDNLDASRKPVDAYLIAADAQTAQRDDPPTRHSRGEKLN